MTKRQEFGFPFSNDFFYANVQKPEGSNFVPVKYLRICLEVEAGVAQIFAYLDQCTNRKPKINSISNTNINTNTNTDIFLHSSDPTTQLNRERVLAHFLSPDFKSSKSN